MTSTTLSDRFIYVSRGNSCPKCQATKDCRYKQDGLVHCHNHRASKGSVEDGYVSRGEDREGFAMWAKSDKEGTSTFVRQMSNVAEYEKKLALNKLFANTQRPLDSHKYWYNQSTFLEQHHRDLLLARGLSDADIARGRFASIGNSGNESFTIPCSDIDGLTRGAQKRHDKGDSRYGWVGHHYDKHLWETLHAPEMPSQWVSAGDRNDTGIIQRDYLAITELWITEGTLKPYITYCKNKAKNVMVVGFSGGTTCWLSLMRGIDKLPQLKTIVILPDAGAALNQQVAKKVITLGAVLNSLTRSRFEVKIADWGQWANKSVGDCDEIESVTSFDVIRRSLRDFKSCVRKHVADEALAEFECSLIESQSEKLNHVAKNDKTIESIAISQDDPSWMKQVGDAINSTTNDAVLLAMNTGFGKTHSIEYLVDKMGLNIIYFNASPDNPATKWIEENGIRLPVKHQGYLPNSSGAKLPSGNPQMVRSDDARADTSKSLENKVASIPASCPMYHSLIASRIGTAEKESPCKKCPKANSCNHLNVDLPAFKEALAAKAKDGKGMLIRCHHSSAPRLEKLMTETPELKDVIFHKVLDDVHPETDTATIPVKYLEKAIKRIAAMDEKEAANIRKFAFSLNAKIVKARGSIYSVEVNPLDVDVESYEFQLLMQVADEEVAESRSLKYDGDDYHEFYPSEDIGFFKGIPGTEFINAKGRTQYKQYDQASKEASIAYLEAEKAAVASRGDALHAAVAKGEIGKLFKTLAEHTNAHLRVDSKELTITWLDESLINTIKSIGGGKIIKMDATIIDSAFCAAWGFPRSRVTQFISAAQDNSNLTFVDMIDIVRLRKDSPIEIADQLTDFALYLTKVKEADVAFISSRDFMGKDNLDRLKAAAIKSMSAFGDSVGSNMGQACTDLIIASSFGINIGALKAEYQVIFKALPYYLDSDGREISTNSFTFFQGKKNIAQLKQAVGRIRHNRRKDEQVRVYLCDVGSLYGDLFSAYPGHKYATMTVSDVAQTPKQNKKRIFAAAQHRIWDEEGNNGSFVAYNRIANTFFPSKDDNRMAANLREGWSRTVEQRYAVGKYGDYKLPALDAFKFKKDVSPLDHAEFNMRECWGKDVPISQLIMVKCRPSMADLHAYCETLEIGENYTPEPINDTQIAAATIEVAKRKIHLEIAARARAEYLEEHEARRKKPDEPDAESERDEDLAAMFAPPVF